MAATKEEVELARHMLAALVYRTRAAVDDTDNAFATFSPGEEVRTPIEIVAHMTDVIAYLSVVVQNTERKAARADSWNALREQFYKTVNDAATTLKNWDAPDADVLRRLVQGPIADAITHAGQLAMLRRMAGAPVPPQNFFKADISQALLTSGEKTD